MAPVSCNCGASIESKSVSTHMKSKKHLQFMKSNGTLSNGLNENQLNFARSEIKHARLIGNPGCGKTRSIIEYCLDKFEKKIISKSSDFIIATFSKNAQEDFVKKGKASNMPTLFSTSNIRTIHSLAGDIFNKMFETKKKSINTIVLATLRALDNKNADDVRDCVSFLSDVKFIVVDEAQDLNYNQYRLMSRLSNILNVPFIMVGDPNQSIYQFQGSSDKYLIEHSGCTYSLVENYRSTQEIVDFVNAIRPHEELPLMVCASGRTGPKPIIYNGYRSDICNYIHATICGSNLNYEDIAIIGPVKRSGLNNQNLGLNLIIHHLYEQNIPYVQHFNDGGESLLYQTKKSVKPGHVNLFTCHGSKGLEFKLTIVIGFHTTTMGRIPSKEDYYSYKNLWYVGLSRAIDRLVICCETGKSVFAELSRAPNHLYETKGNSFKITPFVPKKYNEPPAYSVTKLISNRLIMTEEALLDLQELEFYTTNDTLIKAYNRTVFHELIDNFNFCILYGIFMERLFMFNYYESKNKRSEFIEWLNKRIGDIVLVSNKYRPQFIQMKENNLIGKDNFVDEHIVANTKFPKVNELILYCRRQTNSNSFYLYLDTPAVHYNKQELCNKVKKLSSSTNPENDLFAIILYLYQMEHEKKQLLDFNFDDHLNALSYYYTPIYDLASSYDNLEFEKSVHEWDQSPYIHGSIDAVNTKTGQIIELKFTNDIDPKFEIQTLLYYNMYHPKWNYKRNQIEILNLKVGKKRTLSINENKQAWDLNLWLAKTLDRKINKPIFILDLETNTIDTSLPFTYPNNVEIIERYVYEYKSNSVISKGLIRNQYPLTTSHITTIYEDDMVNADNDLSTFRNEMNGIFQYCTNPIFIAHNGFNFDFPIMEYFNLLDKSATTIDSMPLFNSLTFGKCPDKKLISFYNHIFQTNEVQKHRANADVELMVKIIHHFMINSKEFLPQLTN